MRRLTTKLALAALLLLAGHVSALAGDGWARLRTDNFLFVGDAGDGRLRSLAARLEEFRAVLPQLLPRTLEESSVPTTILVFRTHASYAPFKPLVNGRTAGDVAGYFQSGEEVNYITLCAEAGEREALRTLFHEYVHLLVAARLDGPAPAWFNEGLAEYYSTFEVRGGAATAGAPPQSHLHTLATRANIPLKNIFVMSGDALLRASDEERALFYAQSWALVHALLSESEGPARISAFLNLLAARRPQEVAFKEAFGFDFARAEELLAVRRGAESFVARASIPFARAREGSLPRAATITEAEAESYFGDLLLRMGRTAEAERRLRRALELSSDLWQAHASLGLLLTRQSRFAEARAHLKVAAQLNNRSHLSHYYYAFALSREGAGADGRVAGYTEEADREMRASLLRAIELAPDFPESYALLAWVYLIAGDRLEDAARMAARAVSLSPGSSEHALMLARVLLRQGRPEEARRAVEHLAGEGADERTRERARKIFESAARDGGLIAGETEMTLTPEEVYDAALRRALRQPLEGETRGRGVLSRVECVEGGILFHVTLGQAALRLYAADGLRGVRVVTFTRQPSRKITCGPEGLEKQIIATFRPARLSSAGSDGELVALEFVPADFTLSP